MKYNKLILIISFLLLSHILIYGPHKMSFVYEIEADSNNNLSTSSFEESHILEWNFTWGGAEDEKPIGIALDSTGNIYIAGNIGDNFLDFDIFLAKFNNFGQLQWNRTFNRGGYDFFTYFFKDIKNCSHFIGSYKLSAF